MSGQAYNQQSVNGGTEYLEKDHDAGAALRKIQTAGSISISPELFEKLYLSPENKVKGDLRKTFGNPTPIALIGFLMSLTPLTFDLLGFRGAGGTGAASIGVYYGFGAILMMLGGLLEFFLGNTFPSVVFLSFGAFWFSFASTLVPSFGAYALYSTDPGAEPFAGLEAPSFNASLGMWLISMMVLCIIYLIASVRTNIFFFTIFLTLVIAFALLAAEYWMLAAGNANIMMIQHAAAGFTFVTCLCGWYLFLVQMLASVDFPLNLPVGDMSRFIKGQSEKTAAQQV